MRFHRIVVGLSLLLLTVCGVVAALIIWDHLNTLYPTTETESSFLKNYTPQRVVEQFECNLPSAYLHPSEGAAGREFVTHTAGYKALFAMRSEKWMPLMNSLNDDMSAQLVHNGAQILSRSGDPRSGFHFDYKLGKSLGTVTILPLAVTQPGIVHRGAPLREGVLDVTADIEVAEKWFPKEQGIIQTSLVVSTR